MSGSIKKNKAIATDIKSSMNHAPADLSRRSFLVGSVGTGLLMGFGGITACSSKTDPMKNASKQLAAKLFSPSVWFEINQNGEVNVNIAKAEMGQHVGTALARIVADELGADWSKVSIKHVDTDPKWGYMVTGGSWSVFTSFKLMSQAGAAGRIALIEAAAKKMGVPASQCKALNGSISAQNQSLTFAQLVSESEIDKTYSPEELEALPIKPAAQRQLIGKSARALDIPAKTHGAAQYGLDIELPGMVYARPVMPPTRYGCEVQSVDDTKAKEVSGYLRYVTLQDPSDHLQGWVVVVANNYPAAIKAADAIDVKWSNGAGVEVDEADIIKEGERLCAAKDSGALWVEHGDTRAAAAAANDTLEATYYTSSALHFALEPCNAIAEYTDGKWHLHAGNQWQSLIMPVLSKALDVPETEIVIHQYYLGGGFGRRLYGDYMIPAALTAKVIGKPVKLIFTREDDSRFDCIRSASVQKFDASFDQTGALTGVEHAAAAGWPTLSMAPGFLVDGVDGNGKIDAFSISGADHWYTLKNHRVRAINNELAQETFLPGWLRAVGPGWIGWGVESFIDELAIKAGKNGIDYRLGLLDASGKNAGKAPEAVGGASRLANVLRMVQSRSGWDTEIAGANEGRGVAVCHGQERTMPTWVACVAHVSVNPKSGKVTVHKLTMAIDCGTVVHPDGAMAQAEGAALWGVSLALHEGTTIKQGQVTDRNLNTYTPLRMSDVPELDIQFVNSTEFPTGLGEPPLISVAPAIGNAIYAATGKRVRELPIRAADLMAKA